MKRKLRQNGNSKHKQLIYKIKTYSYVFLNKYNMSKQEYIQIDFILE